MTYLQPISPQEFLLKIPVQTITVSSDKIGFLDCENMVVCDSWLTDGICWFLTASQKFFKSPGQKENLWNQFNEFYIKMSFLNRNSDYGNGKYTSKKKNLWNWFISFEDFFWHGHFFLIFLQCVSGCCYHRIFSCSELSITTFHSFFFDLTE